MLRIRRIYDNVLPVNKSTLSQVQEILRSRFAALSEEEIAAIGEKLRNPFKQRFRTIVFVAESIKGKVRGFAMLLHDPEIRFTYLDWIATASERAAAGIGGALYDRIRQESTALKVGGLFFECRPDDPVRLRPFRYVKPDAVAAAVESRSTEQIALIVNDRHDIHHIHERGYVEAPVRVKSILDALLPSGLFARVQPRPFPDKHLRAVHDADFLGYLKRACADVPAGKSLYPYIFLIRNKTRPPREPSVLAGYYCIDTFTPINANAYPAARRSVDCALTAAREILEGFNLNLPLPESIDGAAYRRALTRALGRIEEFRPQFLVVGLGLDPARGDPTGTWSLTAGDLAANGRQIGALGLPLVVIQEGGYRTKTVGKNALAFFRGLAEGVGRWADRRHAPNPGLQGIVFREKVTAEDAERVGRLVDVTGFFHPEEVALARELVEERTRKGDASGYHFVLAEHFGRLAGYACFGPIPCTEASYDLYWIAVHPDFQGRGLGRRLMSECERRVKAAGGRRIYVDTSQRVQYASTRAFYESSGYRLETILKDFYAAGEGKAIYCKPLV